VSGDVTPPRIEGLLKLPQSTGKTDPKNTQGLNNSFSSEIGSVTGSVSNTNDMYFRSPPKLVRGFIPLPIIPSVSGSPTGTQESPTPRKRKTRKNRNKKQRKTRRR
jgi:hypothetical protein